MALSSEPRDRVLYQDVSLQLSALAAADPSATLIAAKDQHTIILRQITVIVTTAAAQAWLFQTSNGTPVVLFNLEASADEGVYAVPFGEKGYTIPENEGLVLAAGGAGVAGIIIIDAHRRPGAGLALTPAQV